MCERNRAEGSSLLATVEDIQRRLVRPSTLPSPPPPSTIASRDDYDRSRNSSQFRANLMDIEMKKEEKLRETKNKKLEDYLDPYLISAACSKIRPPKKIKNAARTNGKKEVKEFEWPVDELKVFVMEDSRSADKRVDWNNNNKQAVNLNEDNDMIKDVEAEDGEFCTPFWRFEQTTLKLFKK